MFTKKITLAVMLLAATCFSTANAQSSKTKSKAKAKEESGIQKDGFTITKVYVDNPEDLNNVMINFNPLISDVSFTNSSYKLGLDASYRMGKTFAVGMNVNRAILDYGANSEREEGEKDEEGQLRNPVSNSSQIELFGTYFFAGKEGKADTKFLIYSERHGSITRRYYLKYPTTRILLHGVKLGFNRYTTSASTDGGLRNIVFKGKDIETPDASLTYFSEDSSNSAATMVTSNIISIGYNAHWLCNIKFDVKGYGERGASASLSFFGDILYAPSITLNDFKKEVRIDYDNKKVITYNLNDNTEKRSLGFRLGAKYHFHELFGKLNVTYGGELGVRPGIGPMSSGIYAMGSIGLGLGFDVK